MKYPRQQSEPAAPIFNLHSLAVVSILLWSLIVVLWSCLKSPVSFSPIFHRWLSAPVTVFPNGEAALRQGKHLVALAGIMFALFALGHRLLCAAKIKFHNVWEGLAISFALGYGAWGTVLFLLGLAGLWSQNLLRALLGGALILACAESVGIYQRVKAPPTDSEKRLSVLGFSCIAGFLLIWLSVLRYTLTPETFYDALQYHLALPSNYLLNGRIFPTPENSYSGIPALPQMLYGWTLVLDQWGILARLLHHSTVLWIGIGLMGYCRRIGSPLAGYLAAVCFFLAPVVINESFRLSVGMEWALMELCWFTTFFVALTEKHNSPDRKRWLILSGIFLGFAMSTKYPAWLLPMALVPALFIKPQLSTSARTPESIGLHRLTRRELLWILVAAAICLAPWVGKNIWFYKNPIYPFFHEFFVGNIGNTPDWRTISPVGTNIQDTILSSRGFFHYITFPLRFLIVDDDYQSIGLFPICLLPLLLWTRLQSGERLLSWICLASWIPLSLVSGVTRFFTPHLALLILLLSCVLVRVGTNWIRRVLLALTCLFCLAFGFLWIMAAVEQNKLDVFRGKINYSQYLNQNHPIYRGIEYINQNTPEESGVVFYGDPQSFYLRRRYRAASDGQIPLLELWANESSTPEMLRHRLKAEGVNYILINLSWMQKYQQWAKISRPCLLKLAKFWGRYVERVYQERENGIVVFRVLTEAESSQPRQPDPLLEDLVNIPQSSLSRF